MGMFKKTHEEVGFVIYEDEEGSRLSVVKKDDMPDAYYAPAPVKPAKQKAAKPDQSPDTNVPVADPAAAADKTA